MRKERGPSPSRRQTGSEPRDWTCSTNPAPGAWRRPCRRRPRADLPAVQGHGRRAARPPTAAPVGYWSVSQNPPCGYDGDRRRHRRSPAVAVKPAGEDSARAMSPAGTASVPLHSAGKASVFCAMDNEYVRRRSTSRSPAAVGIRCQPAKIGHGSGAGLGRMERGCCRNGCRRGCGAKIVWLDQAAAAGLTARCSSIVSKVSPDAARMAALPVYVCQRRTPTST